MKTIKAYRIITGKTVTAPRTVVFATDKTQAKLSATLTDAGCGGSEAREVGTKCAFSRDAMMYIATLSY